MAQAHLNLLDIELGGHEAVLHQLEFAFLDCDSVDRVVAFTLLEIPRLMVMEVHVQVLHIIWKVFQLQHGGEDAL